MQRFGKAIRGVPVSRVVRAGNFVFVSGTPAFNAAGKLAIGDFTAQMRQAMENVTGALKSAGAGWQRVVKVNVILVHREDLLK